MNREQKDQKVDEIRKQILDARAVFVTNLIGIPSNDAVAIRKNVREANGAIVITRNTLFKRAAAGTKAESLFENLKGPHAVAFAYEDAPSVAKVLYDANTSDERIDLKGGILGEDIIDRAKMIELAKLPSRDQMLATLLATFNAPISAFVRVLHAINEQKKESEGSPDTETNNSDTEKIESQENN